LGPYPIIASLNLGATRRFDLRHRMNKKEVVKLNLAHGSLLVMGQEVQNFYEHQVPQQKKVQGKRINLTFRNVIKGIHM
jgi:alkylated DNA repair dioxygenase AlkB